MKREEFRDCIRLLRKYYPRSMLIQDKETVSLWYEDLKQYPYVLILTGLKAWVRKHPFPPSLAELRSYPKKILHWLDCQKIIRHDMGEDISRFNQMPENEYLEWGCREYLRSEKMKTDIAKRELQSLPAAIR